jgi:hypothetical protein
MDEEVIPILRVADADAVAAQFGDRGLRPPVPSVRGTR